MRRGFGRILLAALCLAAVSATAPAQGPAGDPDIAQAREAMGALAKKDYAKAKQLAGGLKDPLHRRALLWHLLQVKEVPAGFSELAELYPSVKSWPGAIKLAERAEDALAGETPEAVLAWFQHAHPRGVKGWSAYVAALARSGKEDEAAAEARRVWTTVLLPAADEASFQRQFARYLRPDEDRVRLALLLRAQRTAQARALWERAILPAEEKAAAAVRIAMQSRLSSPAEIEAISAKLPEWVREDPDYRFEFVSWHRRAERYEAAAQLLSGVPLEEDDSRRWRIEGNRVVRGLLDEGKPEPAYRASLGFAATGSGETWAAMEFLAGWIALRKLNKPADALAHFARLFERSAAAITRGRGAYWAARAAEAAGDKAAAERWYIQAAGFPHVFYGQLAAARLGHERLALPADERASDLARKALAEDDQARAATFFAALDEAEPAHALLIDLAMEAREPARWLAVADLAANGLRRREAAVRAARRAAVRNVPMFELGFPVLDLPPDSGVEAAFALAIIRQESEFYTNAVSAAGARGLMQLMPATARETAQRLKLRYDPAKLTADETYNLRLGTRFLARMVERYGGLYPLAAAAYNGGPGNVGKWLAKYGDPRNGQIDLIDWIELIPFDETRNYVQRVMENLAIYRHRAGLRALATEPASLWRPPTGDALALPPRPPPEP